MAPRSLARASQNVLVRRVSRGARREHPLEHRRRPLERRLRAHRLFFTGVRDERVFRSACGVPAPGARLREQIVRAVIGEETRDGGSRRRGRADEPARDGYRGFGGAQRDAEPESVVVVVEDGRLLGRRLLGRRPRRSGFGNTRGRRRRRRRRRRGGWRGRRRGRRVVERHVLVPGIASTGRFSASLFVAAVSLLPPREEIGRHLKAAAAVSIPRHQSPPRLRMSKKRPRVPVPGILRPQPRRGSPCTNCPTNVVATPAAFANSSPALSRPAAPASRALLKISRAP